MPRSSHRAALLCSALISIAAPASAQVVKLTTPDATLPEEFSAVRGVRELSDGRLLVSDYIDQRVVLVSFDMGTVIPRVTKGGGPREARLPTRLIALRGDSSALVDLGNNRLLVLDPEGRAVRTISGERIGLLGLRGVDPAGAMYYAVPSWAEQEAPLSNDSVRLVKWNPRTGAESPVTVIQGDRMRSDIREPALKPRIPIVGYGAADAWVVGDGGVVRIVRAGGYRVESHAPGGAVVLGPSYAYPTRPVTAADRLAFVRRFNETSPTSGKGENGGMGYSTKLNDNDLAEMARGTQYAERHPMFADVIAGPNGRLWVGHPAEEGKPVVYDLFDEAGKRFSTVELPAGRRVVAVGRAHLYAVAESDVGIQYLERYPVPR